MNLLKTLAAISSMTLLSRLTGLLRESIFAARFGASAYSDAFIVAFRIPNLLRRLFAEGAFSQAFVPILSEYKSTHGDAATRTLADHVATALVWSTVLTSIVGIVASPLLVWLLAQGVQQTPDAYDASIFMTRLMFPYIACMSFVALAGGVLNTWRSFKVPAFTPVLLNLSFIGSALFLAPRLQRPVYAMAIGVMVGGLLQVAIQLPALRRVGMLPRLSWNLRGAFRDPGVQRILRKMGPAVFAVSAAQISLAINTAIASYQPPGSLSALSYADRLMEFPTAMLGVALGTILLPSLSKASVEGAMAEYSALLDWGLRLTFLLALPAAVGMIVLAEPMIASLFHYGQFGSGAVQAAAAPLVGYAVGLIGIILVKTLAPAFYARQDIRTPVRIAVGVLVATQLMNLMFVPFLHVAGLALSISIGACINAGFLFNGLRQRGIYQARPGWGMFFLRLSAAVVALAMVAWVCARRVDWEAMQAHAVLRVATLLGIIALSAAVYFAVLVALGFRLRDFKRSAA